MEPRGAEGSHSRSSWRSRRWHLQRSSGMRVLSVRRLLTYEMRCHCRTACSFGAAGATAASCTTSSTTWTSKTSRGYECTVCELLWAISQLRLCSLTHAARARCAAQAKARSLPARDLQSYRCHDWRRVVGVGWMPWRRLVHRRAVGTGCIGLVLAYCSSDSSSNNSNSNSTGTAYRIESLAEREGEIDWLIGCFNRRTVHSITRPPPPPPPPRQRQQRQNNNIHTGVEGRRSSLARSSIIK